MDQTTTVASPPIAQIVPFLLAAASYALKFLQTLWKIFPTRFILYLLAPIIVFGQVSFDICIRTPVAFLVYMVDFVYPIYVLAGCAVISGVIIGGLGRVLAVSLGSSLAGAKNRKEV